MITGTVKFVNTTKGFGFIAPEDGSKDVFVHISAVERSGMPSLVEGQKVSFEVQADPRGPKAVNLQRSEEHTSELQSLMRISYAVFCLKKKTRTMHISYTVQHRHNNTHKSITSNHQRQHCAV